MFRLALTLTLVSAASMALEIVAGRALAPYVGMSLYSWTVIIAVVLAGLSIGHWVGGILSDRSARPAFWVAGGLSAAAVSSAVSLGILRIVEPMVAQTGPVAHVSALALAAFLLPSLLAGVLSPLLTKMALDATAEAERGRVLGRMFALGAFGAILGTLVAGLVLISWIGTAGSVLLIAASYAILSLWFWTGGARVGAGVAVVVGIGAPALMPGQLLPGAPCLEESRYFCIRVDDVQLAGRPARVMALDHLAHGVNDASDPALLLTPYVQGVDELVRFRRQSPLDRAFFVGGGAYSLPRAWAARYPAAELVVAELDPAVTRIAGERLWLDEASIVPVHADARAALQGADAGFDVIFGDAFHDISVPPHLVTDEFHALVAAKLAPGGVYVMNVVDALREPLFVLSLATTLRRRFEVVELWLALETLGQGERRATWIVLAGDRPTRAGEIRSTHGLSRRWVQVPVDGMIREVGADRLVALTDDFAPVDRLMSGVLLSADLSEQ